MQTKAQILDGLALGGIEFYELGHKDAGYLCEQGFIILQGSFILVSWKNHSINGVQFNLINLLENGHVARIIIIEVAQFKLLNKYG